MPPRLLPFPFVPRLPTPTQSLLPPLQVDALKAIFERESRDLESRKEELESMMSQVRREDEGWISKY